jgi:hypothetical protein
LPPILPDAQQFLLQTIASMQAQIAALAQQQQLLIANAQNETRVVNGLIPGTDPPQYGVQVLDEGGNNRVQVGDLPNGDIGMQVTDPTTGTTTTILPVYSETDGGNSLVTSSTSYVADPNMPALTATIAASGKALVTASSYIGIPGSTGVAQSAGLVGLFVDGSLSYSGLLYLSNTVVGATAVGIASSQSAAFIASGLSPGQHTFELRFEIVGPSTVNFSNRHLQVQPI